MKMSMTRDCEKEHNSILEALEKQNLMARDGEKEYGSILEALREQFVLVVDKNDDSTVTLIDGCDRVFWVDLNKKQMLSLSDEIRKIAESMQESKN